MTLPATADEQRLAHSGGTDTGSSEGSKTGLGRKKKQKAKPPATNDAQPDDTGDKKEPKVAGLGKD